MLGVLHGWGQGELFLCASQPHREGEEEEEEGAPHLLGCCNVGLRQPCRPQDASKLQHPNTSAPPTKSVP